MSAVLTRRRPTRARDLDAGAQESLFGGWAEDEPREAVAEPAAVATAPGAVTTPAPVRVQTLDEAITSLWGGLLGGTVAACPACGVESMQPRHSASAGVVGGRCGACGTTLA
jgi:ammonia channel protein AmtB